LPKKAKKKKTNEDVDDEQEVDDYVDDLFAKQL